MIATRCKTCKRISYTATEQAAPCPNCGSRQADTLPLTLVKPRQPRHLTLIEGGAA